ncbi:MAG: ECF transporter S component [Promethearchaeota archaeon]
MKKSNIILLLILIIGIISPILPHAFPGSIFDPNVSSNGILLGVIIYLGLFIIGMFFKFEESEISSKEISLIAVYSAFVSIARIPFIGIPSVQPVSYLVFCAGYVFGPLIGFVIGGNVAIISNIFLGQGIWTVYQVFAWGFIGIIGGGLGNNVNKRNKRNKRNKGNDEKKRQKMPNKWIISVIGFFLGFIYGWLTNIWQWLLIRPITVQSFISVNIMSFYFDLVHAVANFIFLYYFGEKTINILYRYRNRFKINFERANSLKINSYPPNSIPISQ